MKLYFSLIIIMNAVSIVLPNNHVVYGSYMTEGFDLSPYSLETDTLIWEYYNAQDWFIKSGKLSKSAHLWGDGIYNMGEFRLNFKTDELNGTLVFLLKTIVDGQQKVIPLSRQEGPPIRIKKNPVNPLESNLVNGIKLVFERQHYEENIHGLLTVLTTPKSRVFLDDDEIGVTPIYDLEVPQGDYQIRFEHPEHPECYDYSPHEKTITVTAKNETFVEENLEAKNLEIVVKTVPAGARVLINKIDQGIAAENGLRLQIKPGSHRFYFELEGKLYSERMMVCENDDPNLKFNLFEEEHMGGFLHVSGYPEKSTIEFDKQTLTAPLSFFPIEKEKKEITISKHGFWDHKIISGPLQTHAVNRIKFDLIPIDYEKSRRLSRLVYNGEFPAGFTGLGHYHQNQKRRGVFWMGMQMLSIGLALHSFSAVSHYSDEKYRICGLFESAGTESVLQAKADCDNAVIKHGLSITYSIGMNLLIGGVHYLSLLDFDR